MVTYTTTNLVTSIQRNSHAPAGNNTFAVADYLAIADMEMRTGVAPKISSCRENYWLTTGDQEIDNSLNEYPIPSKALGSAIVDVKVQSGTNLIHLVRIEVSDLYSTQYSVLPAYGYYILDHTIRLVPQTLTGLLKTWYYRIPSQLVPVTSCGQISAINGTVVTVSTIPSDFVGGGELDIVSQQPGFNVLLKDSEPTSIIGNDITFAALPESVQVGDYVCLSGQSCVVQCPLEWIEVLVQRATCKIYEIQGYEKKHAMAKKVLGDMEANALGLVSPRTIENPKVINGGGSLLVPQTRGWSLPVTR